MQVLSPHVRGARFFTPGEATAECFGCGGDVNPVVLRFDAEDGDSVACPSCGTEGMVTFDLLADGAIIRPRR